MRDKLVREKLRVGTPDLVHAHPFEAEEVVVRRSSEYARPFSDPPAVRHVCSECGGDDAWCAWCGGQR